MAAIFGRFPAKFRFSGALANTEKAILFLIGHFGAFFCIIAMVHRNSPTVEIQWGQLGWKTRGGPIQNHPFTLGRPIHNRPCTLGRPIRIRPCIVFLSATKQLAYSYQPMEPAGKTNTLERMNQAVTHPSTNITKLCLTSEISQLLKKHVIHAIARQN